MEILSNEHLTRGDEQYRATINSVQMYNCPTTFNLDGNKYIIPAGNNDCVTVFRDINVSGDRLYIICENRGLGYIGLTTIHNDRKLIFDGPFFQSEHEISALYERDGDNIFDLDPDEQLNILLQYA